jgi:ABC-type lipoprotein release transport system permease subunit
LPQPLLQILRSARAFARAPGLTSALVLTIALGVGSNAAVYGFLQGLTHPASPLRTSDRIVSIFKQDRSREAGPLSPDDYQRLRSTHGVFAWIAAVRVRPGEITINGHAEIATIAAVTPELAGALAIPLTDGVVLSHRIWESELGGKEDALGSNVRIDNAEYRIGGIAPENLEGLYSDQKVDLWIQSRENLEGGSQDRRDLWVLAHLREDVSTHQAQAALRSGPAGLHDISVASFTGIAPNMAPGLTRVRLFLTFSTGVVFFIACTNVASFLLGRALRRSHETSLRVALGASRAELLRELFADSVVISIAGGATGLLLGMMTAHILPVLLFAEDAQRLTFALHFFPTVSASLVCVFITIFCGMMPVIGTVTDRPWIVLQRETGSPSKTIQRLRSALVVGQIMACCMLVICTALLLSGLHSALETSAGHRLGDPILLTVQAQVRPDGPEVDTNYFSEVEKRVKSVAGLSPLAWMARLPGSQPMWPTFKIQQFSSQYRDVAMDIAWLTPDTLKFLDNQPIAGRMFGLGDQGHRVALVNEEAAKELFGRKTAGAVIRDSADDGIEIIGVFKTKASDAEQQRRPTIYYGYLDQPDAPSPVRDAHFRAPLAPPVEGIQLSANLVSANYFRALDMPLIAGHTFPDHGISGQRRVAVINQEAAVFYFNGKPLGAGVIDGSGNRAEIIGVVGSQIFGTFEQHAEPAIYFPMWQDCPPRMTLIVRYSKWNSGVATDLREKVQNVPGGSSAPIGIDTFDRQLAHSGLAGLRIATLIGGASAVTGVLLSILGLLSSQGDAERQRERERALRIALGAPRWRIVLLVVKNAGELAFVGTAIGTLLSYALLRVMIAGITVVTSPPFLVWLIAPLLPAAAIIIASMLPARRASVVSPATIMREN